MDNKVSTIDNYLSKDDTKIMKAIAVICMLAHHLWCFPVRIPGGNLSYIFTIFGIPSITYFGFFCKICVPMFFFFGGYGVYKSYYGRKYDIVDKLKKLYFSYWKVFLIFIPIGFLFFSKQDAYCTDAFIYSRFANFSSKELVSNFLGFTSTYNREWWFLISYAFALLSFPFIRMIIDKFSAKTNIFLAIVVTILIANIFPGLTKNTNFVLNTNFIYLKFFCQIAPYAASFWMGAIVAKDGLLDRLSEALKKCNLLNPVTDIILWFIAIFLRQSEIGDTFDIFYIPVLAVASIDLIKRIKFVKLAFISVGKQSTNMWLTHSFFCYYIGVTAKVIAAPRYGILSLLILIAMCYVSSIIINLFWKGIGLYVDRMKKLFEKIKEKLHRKNQQDA